MEGHNTWIANHRCSTLIVPVGDLAQHMLAAICYYTQNGYALYDDIAKKPIPGIEKFTNIVDPGKSLPLTVIEQASLAELTAELSTSCYAGVLIPVNKSSLTTIDIFQLKNISKVLAN